MPGVSNRTPIIYASSNYDSLIYGVNQVLICKSLLGAVQVCNCM